MRNNKDSKDCRLPCRLAFEQEEIVSTLAWEQLLNAIEEDGKTPTKAARKAAECYRKGKIIGDTYEW